MNRTPFTDEEVITLTTRYANERTDNIARDIGRSIKSVYAKAKGMGLKKSSEFLRSGKCGCFVKGGSYGVEHRFKKGHTPFNKGMKGLYTCRNSGQFTAGMLPPNTKYDGCITRRMEKNGHDYLYIRIRKAKWELYHRHLWISINGAIPSGMIVIFKDGNSLNTDIDNLMLISRAEHAVRNHNNTKAIQKIRENHRANPDRWYTPIRLSRLFGIDPDMIVGELKDSLVITAKLQKTIRYATHRNVRGTKTT